MAVYSHALGLALPIVNSDHSHVVLIPNPPSRSARYFKYESYWEGHDECRSIVKEGWSCPLDLEGDGLRWMLKSRIAKET